jgi:hypothetical protein
MIEFTLTSSAPASLALFDVAGREISEHEVGSLGPGPHRFEVAAGRTLRPGIYFLRLAQAGRVLTSRVVVLR